MRVCIIGNSHVAALKLGWDALAPDHPDVEIVFFAQRGNHMSDLRVDGDVLIPTTPTLASGMTFTSGGREVIDPADYDRIIVYGLDASAYFLETGRAISHQCRIAAIEDLLASTMAFGVVGKLRMVTDAHLFVGHVPLPAADTVRHCAYPVEYVAGCEAVNHLFCGPMNVRFLNQPLETIVNDVRTHPDFSVGSRKLAIGDKTDLELHDQEDRWHMNRRFGMLWLERFFQDD